MGIVFGLACCSCGPIKTAQYYVATYEPTRMNAARAYLAPKEDVATGEVKHMFTVAETKA